MNLDRALAILGVIIGALGSGAGIYVSQSDSNIGLLLASGWVAAALLGSTICTLAFRAVTAIENSHANSLLQIANTHNDALKHLTSARADAEQRCEISRRELDAVKDEVAEFRNISRALSSVLNGEDKLALPRPKRRAKPSSNTQQADQEQPATDKRT